MPGNIDERVAWMSIVDPLVAVQIVLAELTAGLSYCQLLRVRRYLNQDRPTNLERAMTALNIAEKTMSKLNPIYPEINKIMARTELLRLEIHIARP